MVTPSTAREKGSAVEKGLDMQAALSVGLPSDTTARLCFCLTAGVPSCTTHVASYSTSHFLAPHHYPAPPFRSSRVM